ncbi:LAME_0E13476g1_1 [Lachancea meyersii CBS 8951]|uniref:LAME_0E13476g1_1 n=1 Tax=Lachancea meyersii CBS 8951 TaxID=1266667 RepID=A0A1G4JMQ1_9SACH|nr:LAME_0E13476g1_1 [Lachancea meyersii CBS 8951]
MTKVVVRGGKEVLERQSDDDFSYISIVNEVDIFPDDYGQNEHFQKKVLTLKSHNNVGIGFVLRVVAEKMKETASAEFDLVFEICDENRSIKFRSEDFKIRNDALHVLATKLRSQVAFECLSGWRDEFYAVYCKDRKPYVLVERALSGLLGIVTYGVHVNGFVRNPTTGEIKIWVPRRSATKATWPSLLDNTIAGGLGYPYGIYETVVKESQEEASLPKNLIEPHIRSVGAVSYFYFQGNALNGEKRFDSLDSLITGEIEYLYDLELPPDVTPRPNDDEVESFKLMSLQETIDALKSKEFKPNCALVMLEFLIRHGYVNSENEPNYMEIISRVHRRLPFPTRN